MGKFLNLSFSEKSIDERFDQVLVWRFRLREHSFPPFGTGWRIEYTYDVGGAKLSMKTYHGDTQYSARLANNYGAPSPTRARLGKQKKSDNSSVKR